MLSPTVREARDQILEVRREPPQGPLLRRPNGERWYRRYTPLICDYLLTHLSERELPGWSVAFLALHELTAHAYGIAENGGLLDETDAWAEVSAVDQLLQTAPFTQLPDHFDHLLFVPHYRGFVRFLAEAGAMHGEDAERLGREYDELGLDFLALQPAAGVA
jgi:hypothetical protein